MSYFTKQHQEVAKQAVTTLKEIFRPRPRLKPSEFVEKYRRISPEANAKSGGKWHNLPMQVEPMDSVIDPAVRGTVLMWASQTAGKTEVTLGVTAYFIHEEPAPILMVQPDLNMAEAWSKDRFSTMVRDTPCLVSLVNDHRQRWGGNKILRKVFPAGHLTIAGANSPASLASRPIRVVIFDEWDRFPDSAGKEGDPSGIALKRSDSFHNAVCLGTSTPTIRKHSKIEHEFDRSDKRYWFCVCQYCQHSQTLKWSNVKWESPDSLEGAYYLCDNKECAKKWSDADRIKAIHAGHWQATAPFQGIRGYHLNGIYSLFLPKKGFVSRLHQMAVEFLEAKQGGKETLKVWTNTFLAETWEETNEEKPSWHKLFDRREKYTKLPSGVVILTAGVDIQENRIEVEIVGHGKGEESWGVAHKQFWGDTRLPEIFIDLERFLIQEHEREDGCKLRLRSVGMDTGHAGSQRQAYAFLAPRWSRGYFAFKGSSQKNAEPISHAAKSKAGSIRLLLIGTNRIKSYIYSRATIDTPGPGYMHFPESYTMEWFKQLLSEDCRRINTAGQSFLEFYMPTLIDADGTGRNEALDMRVYAMAALYARGAVNWDYEEKLNLDTIPTNKEKTAAPKRERRRSSFVGDWR